jgi:hypothetical protein
VARIRAYVVVNHELIKIYQQIGSALAERQDAHGWGGGIVAQLAQDLRREFPDMSGLSPRNVIYVRSFARAWRYYG